MKKNLLLLCGFLFVIFAGAMLNSSETKAARDYTKTELKVNKVEDITVFNDYKDNINDIVINTLDPSARDGGHIYKFTLDQDGYISLLLTCRNVKKITERNGSTVSYSSTDTSITATIYRDSGLLYPVSSVLVAKGKNASMSSQPIALDQGIYYVLVESDKYTSSSSNNTNTYTYSMGTGELIVYYEPITSNETYRPSYHGKENKLKWDAANFGMLTVTNPKDYYTFELKERSMIKLNLLYSSKKGAKFVLYGTNGEELLSKNVPGSNVWYNVEQYLEPGIYSFSLETVNALDGGETRILIKGTEYPLNLRQVNKTTNSYVSVDTIIDPKEVRYVAGNLTGVELKSSLWNKANVITDTLKFGINETGYYTVRVTDQFGNMFMQSIKITECDNKAPKIPTIKSYKAETFLIGGTTEKNALLTVSVNGKVYTCTANAKGEYRCTLPSKLVKGSYIEVSATDLSGNVSEKAEAIVD